MKCNTFHIRFANVINERTNVSTACESNDCAELHVFKLLRRHNGTLLRLQTPDNYYFARTRAACLRHYHSRVLNVLDRKYGTRSNCHPRPNLPLSAWNFGWMNTVYVAVNAIVERCGCVWDHKNRSLSRGRNNASKSTSNLVALAG